ERAPETLVELMDIILSKVCRGLKGSRQLLATACTEMESFGIDPEAPEPEKVEILINYIEKLRDESGNMVFTAMEIQEYREYLRKLEGRR
ncbi:MAG: hypothetical protein QW531_03280, partial [Thermoplasmata archaeon]